MLPPANARIRTIGDCVPFDASLYPNVEQAKQYLSLVGCVPGRIIRVHDPKHSPGVIGTSIHGLLAFLAPRGTSVDLTLKQ